MSIRDENGTLLLESVVALFVLLAFAKGAVEVHGSLRHRFDAIVDDRNERIRRHREVATADPILQGVLSLFGRGGGGGGAGRRSRP